MGVARRCIAPPSLYAHNTQSLPLCTPNAPPPSLAHYIFIPMRALPQEMVEGLKGAGYRVGVITNGHHDIQRRKLVSCRAEELFGDAIVVGGEEILAGKAPTPMHAHMPCSHASLCVVTPASSTPCSMCGGGVDWQALTDFGEFNTMLATEPWPPAPTCPTHAVLCCAVLCCAVLCCAVLCRPSREAPCQHL
jgi:hypothetical protein